MTIPAFCEPPSIAFMGMPAVREGTLASIVGIPFDCAEQEFRIGSRFGPNAIREQSRLVRRYALMPEPLTDSVTDYLQLTDIGNVVCTPGDIAGAYPRIQAVMNSIHAQGTIPIGLGGDGAVTLPQLRAASAHHRDLAVIHLDAHTDTYDQRGLNNATTFTRAAEEGLLDLQRSFHVGVRGQSSMPKAIHFARDMGYSVTPFQDLVLDSADPLAAIKASIGTRPVYLCLDLDVFDPSCAPGVCIPEWGGFTAREGMALLRSLRGLNFVAFDINTLSPPHDPTGMTALLAATLTHELCALAAHAVHSFPRPRAPSRATSHA